MTNEYKLQQLILEDISLKQKGLPAINGSLIKECSNLFYALNFIGCTDSDKNTLNGKLNSLLSSVRYVETYTQGGLFEGYYQIGA
jgi:hypothetical protein